MVLIQYLIIRILLRIFLISESVHACFIMLLFTHSISCYSRDLVSAMLLSKE